MDKKNKTMTASRAARELGVSREQVFTMIRQGKLARAGYATRRHHRVALVTAESVLYEKTRRNAPKTRRKVAGGKVSAPEKKTPGAGQRIERRGIPTEIDRADPSTIQTVTPGRVPDGVPCEVAFLACGFNVLQDYSALDAARACCGAAREMCAHYFQLAKACAESAVHFKGVAMWFAVLCAACAAVSIFCAVRCCMP